MPGRVFTLLCLAGLFACTAAASATEMDRLPVTPFAVLPADVRHPESLAVDPASGEIYVGTFDAREPATARNNQVLRFAADGRLLAQRSFGATPLTGIGFFRGKLYVLNFGASKLQRIDAAFTATSPIEDLASFTALAPPTPPARRIDNPDGSHDSIQFGSAGFPAINGMAFDRAGTLYVSDSFQGAIYRIVDATRCRPCHVDVVARDPLLATTGALPFGANGLAFNADESILYINNAGDGRVLRRRMSDGVIDVLADGVYGADGLLFPAASAVQGRRMIVANLALPLTPAVGDEWEEDVIRWNLMQFDLPDQPPAH